VLGLVVGLVALGWVIGAAFVEYQASVEEDEEDAAARELNRAQNATINEQMQAIQNQEAQFAEWTRNALQAEPDAPTIALPAQGPFVDRGFLPIDRAAPPPGSGASANPPDRPVPCRQGGGR